MHAGKWPEEALGPIQEDMDDVDKLIWHFAQQENDLSPGGSAEGATDGLTNSEEAVVAVGSGEQGQFIMENACYFSDHQDLIHGLSLLPDRFRRALISTAGRLIGTMVHLEETLKLKSSKAYITDLTRDRQETVLPGRQPPTKIPSTEQALAEWGAFPRVRKNLLRLTSEPPKIRDRPVNNERKCVLRVLCIAMDEQTLTVAHFPN